MDKSEKNFDVIVIGVGSMGSATCYYLATRGYRVLGLEQFHVVHERGSHTGQSRIIRKAYFEHPDYVPLLEQAYSNWQHIEEKSGEKIFHRTGIVYFGPSDSPTMQGTKSSAELYRIELKEFNETESRQRFPQFNIPPSFQTLFEPDSGFVVPEKAIACYATQARVAGATILENISVDKWTDHRSHVTVHTSKGEFSAEKIIITAGAWTSSIVASMKPKLRITNQLLAWVNPPEREKFIMGNFPCWFVDDPGVGLFYGFPDCGGAISGPAGIKLAHHHPGSEVSPDDRERKWSSENEDVIRHALAKYLPQAGLHITEFKQCLYTNSPDGDFIIDHLPEHNGRVTIACGFSGHGFKFVSVVGEILADLSMEGKSKLPIGFLGLKRSLISNL